MLAVVTAASLAACSGGNTPKTVSSPSVSTTPTTDEHGHPIGDGTTATAAGYTMELVATPKAGEQGALSLRINGAAAADYVEKHTKKLHLIAVSEDFSDVQHLHPYLGEDGVWSVSTTLPEGGTWRVYADFATTAYPDGVIVSVPMEVQGESTTSELAEPSERVEVDGFVVSVSGMISAEEHGMMMLTVTRDGVPVEFEQYLGASGHLIALRTSDGAYAHFHPGDHDHAGTEEAEEGHDMEMPGMLHFSTEVPGAGKYVLYFEFQVDGTLHHAKFTADVA